MYTGINPRPFDEALLSIRAREESDGWSQGVVCDSTVQVVVPSRFIYEEGTHFCYPFTCGWNQEADSFMVSGRLPDAFVFGGVHKDLLDQLVADINALMSLPEFGVDELVTREFRVFPGQTPNSHMVVYAMVAKWISLCRPAYTGALLDHAKSDLETTLCLFRFVFEGRHISREIVRLAFSQPVGSV